MKRYQKLFCGVLCAVLCLGSSQVGILETQAAQALREPAGTVDVAALKAAQDTNQLILVIGNNTSKVMVSYYRKEQTADKKGPGEPGTASWQQVFTTSGVYGKNGAALEKREGDGKTPLGTYQFTMSFGLKEDPGSILPYHRIASGDYWVDDAKSAYYNQLVNTAQTKKAWTSAEDMTASSPYYNYALALNYNADCVPDAGSAIFLHCTKSTEDTGSQGCIRIPEKQMKQLVQSVDASTKIVIVSDIGQLEYR
ncbi:MAG: L,D-transpeptidase family protein [Hungatella sp.]